MLKKKKTIIIAGGFQLPYRNASALYAIGLAKIFNSIGIRVIIAGKINSDPPTYNDLTEFKYSDDIKMCDIRRPTPSSKHCNYIHSSKSIEEIANKAGLENIITIVLYNYPVRAIIKTMLFCFKAKIPLTLNITEWYGWEGKKIFRNILRVASSEFRVRILANVCRNIICASSNYASRFKNKNIFINPFSIDNAENNFSSIRKINLNHSPIRISYVGSPGIGMTKENLDKILSAISYLNIDQKDLIFEIVGLSRNEFLEFYPEFSQKISDLDDVIKFYGRIPHANAIKILAKSHYSIFIRPKNKVSMTGFPTKYAEANALGVPVITNITSDIGLYLKHLENGIIVNSDSEKDILKAFNIVLNLKYEDYQKLRINQLNNNPFHFLNYSNRAQKFINDLK